MPPFRPLEGVRIVALEQAVAMPYCTFVLAELGAEVIKIERPGSGDVIRGWDSAVHGMSTGFVWVNAGKRSVALDVAKPEGAAVLMRLVEGADVFVENLAPGAADRLGFGADALRSRFPALIHCSLSGFGADGPYGGVKSYDLTVQAESGILLTNGYPGLPAKVGLPITDLIAGSNAAIGIQAALIERARTGTGRALDVTMLDSALLWLGYFPHHAWHSGTEPPLSGMRHQYIVPYGPYLASDGGYICLAVADDRQWRVFCREVVGREDWIDDPRIATIPLRRANRELADGMVEAVIAEHPRDYWAEKLRASGIPFGQVRTINEVISHPQALARRMFVEASTGAGASVPLVRFPLADADATRALPDLGGDTAAVLKESGFDDAAVAALRNDGII